MNEVPELAGLEDAAYGMRKLDETPAGRLVRCADLVTHIMRRDGLGLAEAVGHVVQALASVGDGLELFHLRPGKVPAYAARWEPVVAGLDGSVWSTDKPVPVGYRLARELPTRSSIRVSEAWGGEFCRVSTFVPRFRLVWAGDGPEPLRVLVAERLAILGNQWRARVGRGSLDRGGGWSSNVAVRSSAARAAGLLGTAEVLALPVTAVATATPAQWTEADKQAMREARARGESDSSIAKRYGFSRQRLAELIGSRTHVRLQAAVTNRNKAA